MKICIPTMGEKGLGEKVSEHFGSAPSFTIIDLESNAIEVIDNQNQHHEHGQCNPIASLAGIGVNVVICGGMGQGALNHLKANGIKVYLGRGTTVNEFIADFKAGNAGEYTLESTCVGHGCH